MGDSKAAVTSKAHASRVMTHESFIHGAAAPPETLLSSSVVYCSYNLREGPGASFNSLSFQAFYVQRVSQIL